MGVKACSRKNCENIMCDICIDGKWYLCRTCFEELKEYKRQWQSNLTTLQVLLLIKTFIKTTLPGTYNPYSSFHEDTEENFEKLIIT